MLRTLQDGYRVTGSAQLWACFVDFKQVFDSVPRLFKAADLAEKKKNKATNAGKKTSVGGRAGGAAGGSRASGLRPKGKK